MVPLSIMETNHRSHIQGNHFRISLQKSHSLDQVGFCPVLFENQFALIFLSSEQQIVGSELKSPEVSGIQVDDRRSPHYKLPSYLVGLLRNFRMGWFCAVLPLTRAVMKIFGIDPPFFREKSGISAPQFPLDG